MELVVKRTLIMLMLVAAFLVAGLTMTGSGALNLGSGTAYAGEDGCDDDQGCGSSGSSSGSDTGSSPSGGVNTGGGGLADGSGPSTWPIALSGLGALGAGTLLVRRLASHNG
jgi:hypothetical protein